MADLDVDIRQIEPGDRLTGLSLGDPDFQPLKTFVERDAKKYHQQNLAKTYAAFSDAGKLIAYVTMIAGEITTERPEDLAPPDVVYHYKSYPAVKIARLAVDRRYRGTGLGAGLISFCLGMVKNAISPLIGCRFVVVDSKQKSVGFYEKCGFTIIDTASNKERPEPVMFIDMDKIPDE